MAGQSAFAAGAAPRLLVLAAQALAPIGAALARVGAETRPSRAAASHAAGSSGYAASYPTSEN